MFIKFIIKVKKIIYILVIFNYYASFSQASKQEKDIAASMVYGFFVGMENTLESVYEYEPGLRSEIVKLNLLKTTNFPNSKNNAISYLKNEVNSIKKLERKFDSIKIEWKRNILVSSKEEKINALKEIEGFLKGKISSPMLENVLSFEYQNQPHKEYVNGYTFKYNTKGHNKAKNKEFSIEIPKSWTAKEGKQPNVIQHFTSDCGNGQIALNLITQEFPINNELIDNADFELIDEVFQKDFFNEETIKEMIGNNKFISFKPMKIAGRSGCLIIYENVSEKMNIKIKMRTIQYIFHDVTHLHFISFYISSDDLLEDLDNKYKIINPLFFMIVNSIIVPKNNESVIELKGTKNQKIIEVKIAENNFDFILDTGASTSLISKNIINNLLENGRISSRNFIEKKYLITADGKKHLVELWKLPQIVICGKKVNDIDFAVIDGNITPLLGMNIINKLNIYKIDFENNKIYLKNEN